MTDFHGDLVELLPRLRRIALAMTHDRQAADDLVQEAAAKALAAQASFTPGSNFGGWVYRILRNEFLSGKRRARKTVPIDSIAEGQLRREPNQEARVIAREVATALMDLPLHQREALILVAIEKLSYEEIAAQTDVSVGTAKSRVCRARRELQRRMLMDSETRERNVRGAVRAHRSGPPMSTVAQ
jgi:RNA polymerase sigma-70 factor, ECF subfamily